MRSSRPSKGDFQKPLGREREVVQLKLDAVGYTCGRLVAQQWLGYKMVERM